MSDPQPGAPQVCDHCGRTTTEWTVQERDDDRGPLTLIWCRDSERCATVGRARRTRRTA